MADPMRLARPSAFSFVAATHELVPRLDTVGQSNDPAYQHSETPMAMLEQIGQMTPQTAHHSLFPSDRTNHSEAVIGLASLLAQLQERLKGSKKVPYARGASLIKNTLAPILDVIGGENIPSSYRSLAHAVSQKAHTLNGWLKALLERDSISCGILVGLEEQIDALRTKIIGEEEVPQHESTSFYRSLLSFVKVRMPDMTAGDLANMIGTSRETVRRRGDQTPNKNFFITSGKLLLTLGFEPDEVSAFLERWNRSSQTSLDVLTKPVLEKPENVVISLPTEGNIYQRLFEIAKQLDPNITKSGFARKTGIPREYISRGENAPPRGAIRQRVVEFLDPLGLTIEQVLEPTKAVPQVISYPDIAKKAKRFTDMLAEIHPIIMNTETVTTIDEACELSGVRNTGFHLDKRYLDSLYRQTHDQLIPALPEKVKLSDGISTLGVWYRYLVGVIDDRFEKAHGVRIETRIPKI